MCTAHDIIKILFNNSLLNFHQSQWTNIVVVYAKDCIVCTMTDVLEYILKIAKYELLRHIVKFEFSLPMVIAHIFVHNMHIFLALLLLQLFKHFCKIICLINILCQSKVQFDSNYWPVSCLLGLSSYWHSFNEFSSCMAQAQRTTNVLFCWGAAICFECYQLFQSG